LLIVIELENAMFAWSSGNRPNERKHRRHRAFADCQSLILELHCYSSMELFWKSL